MEQADLDPDRVTFVDEFGINLEMTRTHARAPDGERAYATVPGRARGNFTLLYGLRRTGVVAPIVFPGAVNATIFAAWLRRHLGPTLRPGDVVVYDRLRAHRSDDATAAIAARGATLLLLPAYSPDLNPIENSGSKVKTRLRAAAARTWEPLLDAVAAALHAITRSDVSGWMELTGYLPKLE